MKKWGLFLLMVLVVFAVSTPVEASNWILIGSTDILHTYLDIDSISDGPNGSKEAEYKFLYNVPPPGANYRERVEVKRFFVNKTDCFLSQTVFYTDGNVNQQKFACPQIQPIRPGHSEKIWNYLYQ